MGTREPTCWREMSLQPSGNPTTASIEGCTSAARSPALEPPRGSEASVARLFEMTSELLATISHDGYFTLLNTAWEKLLGWTREELQASPIHDFMHPDDL